MDDVTRRELLKTASAVAVLPNESTAQQIVVTPDYMHAPLPGETVITSPCRALGDIKTLVAGQSNAHAIRVAMVEGSAVALAKSLGLGGVYEQNPTPAYWDAIPVLCRSRNLALVLEGNGAFLVVTDGVLIDFIPRSYPAKTTIPGARIVPESLIRRFFQDSMDRISTALSKFPPTAGLKRLLIALPPPLADNDVIRRRWVSEPALVRRAKEMGVEIANLQITPGSVRLKLWYVCQEMMKETAESVGWPYVPVPPEAFDPNGFLKLELAAAGVTHANEIYGAMMIKQMALYLT
jgi:hypothetical protein